MTIKKLGFIALLMSTSITSKAMDTQKDYENWLDSILSESTFENNPIEEEHQRGTKREGSDDLGDSNPVKKQKTEEAPIALPMAIEEKRGMKRPRNDAQDEIERAKKYKLDYEITYTLDCLPPEAKSVVLLHLFRDGTYKDVTNLLCISKKFTSFITSTPPQWNPFYSPNYIRTFHEYSLESMNSFFDTMKEDIPTFSENVESKMEELTLSLKWKLQEVYGDQENFYFPKIIPFLLNARSIKVGLSDRSLAHLNDDSVKEFSQLTNLVDLKFDGYERINDFTFLKELTKLENLDLIRNGPDQGEFYLYSPLTNLKSLSINEDDLTIIDDDLGNFTSLTKLITLTLLSPSHVTNYHPLTALTNLQELTINHQEEMEDDGFKSISSLTNLTVLNFPESNLSDTNIPYLLKLTRLCQLEFPGSDQVSSASVKKLTALTNLKVLNSPYEDLSFGVIEENNEIMD